MEKKNTFNNIICDYEKARPGYPIELFENIIRFSGIENSDNILEIGSGTGQATEYFLDKNYIVTGLEIGSNQADYLTMKYKNYNNFKCVGSSFEEFDSRNKKYDLIFAATSFHWIKPEVGYPKAYELLKDKGTLAVFWHMSSIKKYDTDIFNKISDIYSKIAPQLNNNLKSQKEIEQIHNLRLTEFQTNNLFNMPKHEVYQWTDKYSAERYISLLNTYSGFQMLEENDRSKVLDSVRKCIESETGYIEVPQEVKLYMSKK